MRLLGYFENASLITDSRDCWNRPITGVPTRKTTVLERQTLDFNKTFRYNFVLVCRCVSTVTRGNGNLDSLTGRKIEALNFASYNYLGFAQSEGPCADAVEETVKEYGISSASTRAECGTLDLHRQLERKVAQFVGKEDAIVVSMGFATNSTTIPAIVEKVRM